MNRSEIAISIRGASDAIGNLKNFLENCVDEKEYLKSAANNNSNNYKGASSGIVDGKLLQSIKNCQSNSNIIEQKKSAILSRISELNQLDCQLAAEEERQRERERERQIDAARAKTSTKPRK